VGRDRYQPADRWGSQRKGLHKPSPSPTAIHNSRDPQHDATAYPGFLSSVSQQDRAVPVHRALAPPAVRARTRSENDGDRTSVLREVKHAVTNVGPDRIQPGRRSSSVNIQASAAALFPIALRERLGA
jgi:hypothetical protein